LLNIHPLTLYSQTQFKSHFIFSPTHPRVNLTKDPVSSLLEEKESSLVGDTLAPIPLLKWGEMTRNVQISLPMPPQQEPSLCWLALLVWAYGSSWDTLVISWGLLHYIVLWQGASDSGLTPPTLLPHHLVLSLIRPFCPAVSLVG
jgi:hypothetical protein